jgi:hypothetical protein
MFIAVWRLYVKSQKTPRLPKLSAFGIHPS